MFYCFIKTLFISAFLLISLAVTGQVSSTFNTNAQGWTTPNDADGTIGYSGTGGNPDGHVFGTPYSINLGAGTVYYPFYFVAPAAYLGNRSTYYRGRLQYDVQQSTSGTPNQYAEVILTDNAGISVYYFPATSFQPPAAPAWGTFSVPLHNSSGFWKTGNSATASAAAETQVQSILSDLATLQIRGLYRDANTTNRLDNVYFNPPINITTHPAATAVCEGATTTFTAAATGTAVTYQWQFESSPGSWESISNGGAYSGTDTNTLSVNTAGNVGAGNYRCQISGFNADNVLTSVAALTINARPAPPTVVNVSLCIITVNVALTASGGTNGQYRWYTTASGGVAIAGQTSNTYIIPLLTLNTTMYVSIHNGTCESERVAITASLLSEPTPPTTSGASLCGNGSVTLTAAGGVNGQYRWYTAASGGSPIAGQTNSTFTTPVLTGTATYYVAINLGLCESTRTPVTATINTPPAAPTADNVQRCGDGTVVLTASGGSAGQYRWYTVATGGSPIAGFTNNTYTTPTLTIGVTAYYAALHNGTCESSRTLITVTVNALPDPPVTTGNASCIPASVTLSATGAVNGQYRWYTVITGGSPIADETSNSFITPPLSATTTYYVSIHNGICESNRAPVVATIAEPGCDNVPPVFQDAPMVTQIGGQVMLNLDELISDANDDHDLTTLSIISQPGSGAVASIEIIDGIHMLVIRYSNIAFSGIENIVIRVCDSFSACTEHTFSIEVAGEIEVFTALSPNGDGMNDKFLIEHIGTLENTRENHVTIFNRWGDVVWEGTNYDNQQVVFTGRSNDHKDLPSGTYYYVIRFSSGHKQESGYLSLKR